MNRRNLILSITAAIVSAVGRAAPTWQAGNALGEAYNRWAALRNARVSNPATVDTLSAAEMIAWQKVKSAWRALQKSVDAEYDPRR